MVQSSSAAAVAALAIHAAGVSASPFLLRAPPSSNHWQPTIAQMNQSPSPSSVNSQPTPTTLPEIHQLGPLIPHGWFNTAPFLTKYGSEAPSQRDLHDMLFTRAVEGSDEARLSELVKLLQSRELSDELDARDFKSVWGKISEIVTPILDKFVRREEGDNDGLASLAQLLNSRELSDELVARGIWSKLLPFAFSATPQAIDTFKNLNSGSSAQRRSEFDEQWERLLNSREVMEDLESRGIFSFLFNSIPKIVDRVKTFADKSSPPPATSPVAPVAPAPIPSAAAPAIAGTPVKQRRDDEVDIKELERLLGRELTDVERRGLGKGFSQYAPLIPVGLQVADWVKNNFFSHEPQATASTVPQ